MDERKITKGRGARRRHRLEEKIQLLDGAALSADTCKREIENAGGSDGESEIRR